MPVLRSTDKWPRRDKDIVRDAWREGLSAIEIAPLLEGRYTEAAIAHKAHKMGVQRKEQLPKGHEKSSPKAIHPMWEMDEDERRVEFILMYERGMAEVRARYLQDKWLEERV